MICSMTGFAEASGDVATCQWRWELRSVNHRGLDIRLRLPPGLDRLEVPARQALSKALTRGAINATLTLEHPRKGQALSINDAALRQAIEATHLIQDSVPGATVTADGLLALRGVIELTDDTTELASRDEAELLAGLTTALQGLRANRRDEGARIGAVLTTLVDDIERLVDEADANPCRQPDIIRARLEKQVEALLNAASSLDQSRLHQEAALLATKADIREELDRLVAHVAAARDLLAGGGAIGRKLDFLTQEFNREANTLCSKSNDTTLTATGLALKAVVDQMREQVQNIE